MGLFSTKITKAELKDNMQVVDVLVHGGYSPAKISVKAGILLRLVFERQEDSDCTEYLVIDEYNINQKLEPFAKTAIEFTPQKVGTLSFHCGMGMVHGKIIVEQ